MFGFELMKRSFCEVRGISKISHYPDLTRCLADRITSRDFRRRFDRLAAAHLTASPRVGGRDGPKVSTPNFFKSRFRPIPDLFVPVLLPFAVSEYSAHFDAVTL